MERSGDQEHLIRFFSAPCYEDELERTANTYRMTFEHLDATVTTTKVIVDIKYSQCVIHAVHKTRHHRSEEDSAIQISTFRTATDTRDNVRNRRKGQTTLKGLGIIDLQRQGGRGLSILE